MCTGAEAAIAAPSAGTIGNVGLGLQVAGLFSGSRAASDASKATRAAYEHQAAVEKHRAQVAGYQAADARERAKQGIFKTQLNKAALKGAQKARFAAAGLDVNEGSAFNILMDTEYMGKTDELTIADNAEKEAWMFLESAKTGESNAAFLAARAAAEDPSRAAMNTLLGGAGQVASTWYRLRSGNPIG